MSLSIQHYTVVSISFNSKTQLSLLLQTPSGVTLKSTSHEGDYFYLSLPEHLDSGNYTCWLNDQDPSVQCLDPNSTLLYRTDIFVDQVIHILILKVLFVFSGHKAHKV